MKFLIVLVAVVACAVAKPGVPLAYNNGLNFGYNFGYSAATPYNYGYSSYAAPLNYGYSNLGYAAPIAAPIAAPLVQSYAVAPAVATGFKSQYHSQDELGQASYGHSEPLQTHNAVQDAHGNKIGSYSYVSPDGQIIRTDYVADAAGFRVASNALPVGPTALPIGPAQISDTPEVIAARSAHLAEFEAIKHRTKRGAVLAAPLAYSGIHAPLAYSGINAPLAYSGLNYAAPLAYSGLNYAAPLAYSGLNYGSPLAYSGVAAPLAYSAVAPIATPAVREATLTTVVNNPGHAVSYRVD